MCIGCRFHFLYGLLVSNHAERVSIERFVLDTAFTTVRQLTANSIMRKLNNVVVTHFLFVVDDNTNDYIIKS